MTPYYQSQGVTIYHGDSRQVLEQLPDESVHCVVTSPPYWGLRDYGENGQMGLEETPEEFLAGMVELFGQVRRVLRTDGTCWINMGDSYAGSGKGAWDRKDGQKEVYIPAPDGPAAKIPKIPAGLKPKDLCGIPWRLALALQADGWWLRQDIIWHKPNPMPESVTDRCTKAHEYVFLMTKAARYYYDADAVKEESVDPESINGRVKRNKDQMTELHGDDFARVRGGFVKVPAGKTYPTRNRRSVWTIPTAPYPGAHFATFPPALVEPCIKAGCPEGGVVLDPFMGSGTAGQVAVRHSCEFIGIELSEDYIQLALGRFKQQVLF